MLRFGRFRFSLVEIKEMLISAIILAYIFGYPFSQCNGSIDCITSYVGLYLLLVGVGFILHETAHKLVAQSFNVWAEYRMWTGGLLFALLLKMVAGFVFAAPGATYFSPYRHGVPRWHLTSREVGIISLAGPVTNVALALIFALLAPALGSVATAGVYINLLLALFNMIPIPPLDGSKVMAWSFVNWLLSVVIIISLQGVLL